MIKKKDQIKYEGRSVRLTLDFFLKTLKATRTWMNVLKAQNQKSFPFQ